MSVLPVQTKNFWESQGFLIGVITLLGSLWGLSEASATSLVVAVTGGVGAIAAVLQFFKTSKFRGISDVLKDGNTWVYLTATFGAFLPNAGELFPALRGVVDAIISKNFGLIISSLVALGVMVYNIFIKKKSAVKPALT